MVERLDFTVPRHIYENIALHALFPFVNVSF